MAERKKRLEKGIESIGGRIEKHKEKIKKFGQEKNYLAKYWEKQIAKFEEEKNYREKLLKRKRR